MLAFFSIDSISGSILVELDEEGETGSKFEARRQESNKCWGILIPDQLLSFVSLPASFNVLGIKFSPTRHSGYFIVEDTPWIPNDQIFLSPRRYTRIISGESLFATPPCSFLFMIRRERLELGASN